MRYKTAFQQQVINVVYVHTEVSYSTYKIARTVNFNRADFKVEILEMFIKTLKIYFVRILPRLE